MGNDRFIGDSSDMHFGAFKPKARPALGARAPTRKALGFLRPVEKAWDPGHHPRAPDGKFGEAGDGGGSGATPTKLHNVHEVTAQEFKQAFDRAFEGKPRTAYVTHYTLDELKGFRCFTAEGGKVGVAVHDHGDGRVEGTALFNNGGPKGGGIEMLRHVRDHAGVNYGECYGPKLNKLYETLGLRVDQTFKFDPSMASPAWDYVKDDHPDYMTMRLPGEHVSKAGGKKMGMDHREPDDADKLILEIQQDSAKYRKKLEAEIRRDAPHMTDEQVEACIQHIDDAIGL